MIITRSEMKSEKRENMRDGNGVIGITHLENPENMKNGRLFAEIDIPAGASIGPHEHGTETEYYYILEGEGIVEDDGKDTPVKAGEMVVTGGGASHSIRNSGDVPIKMIAVIVTY
jgi:mannose-6-phosphate isomerase-like protein (cupin superfamily)